MPNPLYLKRPKDLYTQVIRDPFAPNQRVPQGGRVKSPGQSSLLHRRGARGFGIKNYSQPGWDDLEKRAVSLASRPKNTIYERILIREWFKRKLVENIDWVSQEQFAGGRSQAGGELVDFTLYLHGKISVEPDGFAWHSGLENHMADEIRDAVLKGLGYTEVYHIPQYIMENDDLLQAWLRSNLGL